MTTRQAKTLSLIAEIFSAEQPGRTLVLGMLCTEPVESNLSTKFLIVLSEGRL